MRKKPSAGPLFDGLEDESAPLHAAPLVRRTDPTTSANAAGVILPNLGKIQRLVLEAFRTHGPMSQRQAEKLEEFSDYGHATIRKRVSELAAGGILVGLGTETSSGKTPSRVYGLPGEGSGDQLAGGAVDPET